MDRQGIMVPITRLLPLGRTGRAGFHTLGLMINWIETQRFNLTPFRVVARLFFRAVALPNKLGNLSN